MWDFRDWETGDGRPRNRPDFGSPFRCFPCSFLNPVPGSIRSTHCAYMLKARMQPKLFRSFLLHVSNMRAWTPSMHHESVYHSQFFDTGPPSNGRLDIDVLARTADRKLAQRRGSEVLSGGSDAHRPLGGGHRLRCDCTSERGGGVRARGPAQMMAGSWHGRSVVTWSLGG